MIYQSSACADETVYFSSQMIEQNKDLFPNEAKAYLSNCGPLNKCYGVIGSNGPLSPTIGPFAENMGSPLDLFKALSNWQVYQEFLTSLGGPLSKYGPSFLSTEAGRDFMNELATSNIGSEYFSLLKQGEPLHILGSDGALGTLSIASLFGTNGATGLSQDSQGNFRNTKNKIQTSFEIDSTEGKKNYPLYEQYTQTNVKSSDSFFAIDLKLNRNSRSSKVSFKSNKDQWISILTVNGYWLDWFDIEIRELGSSKPLISSATENLSNFIVVHLPKDIQIEVEVKLRKSQHILPNKLVKLLVTGSAFESTKIVDRPFYRKVKINNFKKSLETGCTKSIEKLTRI